MDKPLTTFKALAAGAAVVTAVTIGADEGKPTNNPPDLGKAHLRVARPTDNWVAVVKFYRDGLGFEVLYEFKDHDGFDGVMLGGKGAAYHLEFTSRVGHKASRAPTEDNLSVFYTPNRAGWMAAVAPARERWAQAGETVQPVLGQEGADVRRPRRVSGGFTERRVGRLTGRCKRPARHDGFPRDV